MSSTTVLTFREGEQRYGLSLAPPYQSGPWRWNMEPLCRLPNPCGMVSSLDARHPYHPSPSDGERT